MHLPEIGQAFVIFAGLYLLSRLTQQWPSLRRDLHFRHSRSWPVAVGVIQEHRVLKRSSRLRRHYRAVLEYSYPFGGQSFSATFAGDILYLEGEALRWLERYPVGMSLVVRVNPARPEDSMPELPSERQHDFRPTWV